MFADRLLGGVTQVVVIQYYFCVRLALAAARPHTTHTHTHTVGDGRDARVLCKANLYSSAALIIE